MSGSSRKARAMASRCFCPPLSETPALADHRVVTVLEPRDEFMRMRRARRRDNPFLRRVRPAVGDVLRDRRAEEHRLLEDHADRPAQPAQLEFAGHRCR